MKLNNIELNQANADFLGETLRKVFFTDDGTWNFQNDVTETLENTPEGISIFCGIKIWDNMEIACQWCFMENEYYLAFELPYEHLLVNKDAKKDYGWEFIPGQMEN